MKSNAQYRGYITDDFVNMELPDGLTSSPMLMIHNENNKPITEHDIKTMMAKMQIDDNFEVTNIDLYQQSLTHKSYMGEKTGATLPGKFRIDLQENSYERLEFLGDSVLHLILAEYLYSRYQDQDEGFLTRLRTKIENSESFAYLSEQIGLPQFVVIAKQIEISQGRHNRNILEDVFEAFNGALFLDAGIHVCKQLMIKLVESKIDISKLLLYDTNYKDRLLRYYHQQKWIDPVYYELGRSGPAHSRKFTVYVLDDNKKRVGLGTEASKKRAEQIAAREALRHFGILSEEMCEVVPEKLTEEKPTSSPEKETKDDNDNEEEDHIPLIYNKNNKLVSKKNIKQILSFLSTEKVPKFSVGNLKLYQLALTHKSYVKKTVPDEIMLKIVDTKEDSLDLQESSYERLKFLGSSVLHMVLAYYLFRRFPEEDEGFLTRLRTKIENGETVAYLAKEIGITDYILISEQIEITHGRENKRILKETCSAFIGALYLDTGYSICESFLTQLLEKKIDVSKILQHDTNYKDRLLRHYHQMKWPDPVYYEQARSGPAHERQFTMYVNDNKRRKIGSGTGTSKKVAEQLAAKQALTHLGVITSENTE